MTGASTGSALSSPFRSGPFAVKPEWIDDNGHLNLAYFVVLFDFATDALWQSIGIGDALRALSCGTFAAETHTLYRAELTTMQTVTIDSQILGLDAKRLHVAHEMRRDDIVSAQQELMFLNVSLETRKVAAWPDTIFERLRAAAGSHATLARPGWIGRSVAMPTPP